MVELEVEMVKVVAGYPEITWAKLFLDEVCVLRWDVCLQYLALPGKMSLNETSTGR